MTTNEPDTLYTMVNWILLNFYSFTTYDSGFGLQNIAIDIGLLYADVDKSIAFDVNNTLFINDYILRTIRIH